MNMQDKRYNVCRVIAAALMLLCTTAVTAQEDANFKMSKSLEIFNSIYRGLDMMYVDTLDAEKTIGTGISAMLRSLDPYTVYYPEDKTKELRTMITGKYAGIGALIRYNLKDKRVVIDEPYEGTPAQEAGLKKGDEILSIDDSVMTDKDVAYVSNHLRGDAGTTFLLKVRRPETGKTLEKKITRRPIQLPAMPYYGVENDSVGYINLNSFTEDCAKEFRYALIDLKKQGIKNLVLDLRGNGGGSLSEAVKIVNMFVPKGKTVVTTKGKIARAKSEYKTTVEPIDTITPMVVLVNGETASASEITSGALQDYKRATILGTKTFGKGLVQVPIDLPYNGQLKLTTSKYYLPSGRCVQGTGVVPDLEVKADSLPNIVFYLSASGVDSTEVMFEYVKDYLQKHPTIAPAKDFDLTDEEYDEFKQRVLTSGFTYDPQSAKVMKELKKIMEFEGYYDDAKTEFEQLEKKLQHNLARDLDRHKKIIKQAIVADIVAAYYYQRGIVQVALRNDRQYEEALKFFNNKK